MEDLGGRPVFDPGPASPRYWFEAMLPERSPGGRLIPRGPLARTFHEILALVAHEQIVSPLNGHVTWYYTHPGITYLPIHDAPLTQWALVWLNAAGNSPHLRAFVQTARDLGPHPITHHAP